MRSGGAPPKTLWEAERLNPSTASPLVLGDRIYCVRGAILTVGDLKTGELRGQLRLRGAFSSSPVAAGGLLYCVNEDGVVHVVRPAEKEPTLVTTAELGQRVLCTPAIVDGAVYVRSDEFLWKLGKK